MDMKEESVVKGYKLFLNKNMEVKQEEYRKIDEIKQKLAKETKGEDNIDVKDIKQIAATNKMERKSMKIIQLEFERMPELDNEKGRGWKHKRTGQTFCSINCQTRIHGILEFGISNLKLLSGERGTMGDRVLIDCAKLIMH